MKTYPFIRVLINLYWLLVLILIGILTAIVFKPLSFEGDNLVEASSLEYQIVTATTQPTLSVIEKKGKDLFRTNCATCHNKNMKSDMTGPALAGVRERWSDFPEKDLYDWIRNSSKLVDLGHPRAVAIYKEWNKSPMTAFTGLTDEDITALLSYIETVE